jgi:hypothetical protein
MSRRSLRTAISGSFKFKPEIDALHEAFADYDVMVTAPEKGWLWLPNRTLVSTPFRPLPSERGLSIRDIEAGFLAKIKEADFLYVYNQESYLGVSTAIEIGYAIGTETPIYAQNDISFLELADGDLAQVEFLESRITIAGVAETVRLEYAGRMNANVQAIPEQDRNAPPA